MSRTRQTAFSSPWRDLRLAIVLVPALFGACYPYSWSPTRDEVIGEYVAQYDYGSEALRVKTDGTYEQRFTDSSRQVQENRGTWTFTGKSLVLDDAVFQDDGFGRRAKTQFKGVWNFQTVQRVGQKGLLINPDLDLMFVKVR